MTLEFRVYDPPVVADRSAELLTVDDAYLTPFSRRPIPTHLRSPSFFHTGAVYDRDGALIPTSQRWGGYGGDYFIAADESNVLVAGGRVVGGAWLYLGNWMGQFGHWITETLPNVWALGPELPLNGILCHPFVFGNDVREWQRRLLDDAGAAGLEVRVTGDTPVRVERLYVPTRPVVLNAFAMPEAVEVWERVAASHEREPDHPRVFLSSSAWRESRGDQRPRSYSNQWAVDETFAAAGFYVVAPETLSIEQQVSLARQADLLAGWSGSALHLSVFATASTSIIELGDKRSGANPVPHQRVLTAARRQPHAFVQATPSARDSDSYDVEKLTRLLDGLPSLQ